MVSYQDLLIGLVLMLFFFGAKRLPELAESLGKSMKEFKKGLTEAGTEQDAAALPKGTEPVSPTIPRACVHCSSSLAEDWSHCPRCGTPVAREPHA